MDKKEWVCKLVKDNYGIEPMEIEFISGGVGGDTFLVKTNEKNYILKCSRKDGMNHPEQEPRLCNFLLQHHITAPEFVKASDKKYTLNTDDGRFAHLYSFIEGDTFAMNTAPEWFMNESALLLGKVHEKLQGIPDLPVGIGKAFFENMTVKRANESYNNSYKKAEEMKDDSILEELDFRIHLTETMPKMRFDMERLTVRNTHGDYNVNQIVCGDGKINGVIDWTCACMHPVVWEVTRSFYYAEPTCIDGSFDERKFSNYVSAYCSVSPLSQYDRDNLLRLYFYQLAVCDYYNQYLNADEDKKNEFLQQAHFATNVLRNLKDLQ